MDETKAVRQQTLGIRAEELLKNELLQQTFDAISADYIWSWKRTDPKDADARERLWTAVKIVEDVQIHLRRHVENGKLATKDLASIKYLKS